MKSVMSHDFAKNPTIEAPRSSFDRSFGYKTEFDAAELIPFYVDDVLPGDTFNLKTTGFARMATQAFPIMDNMYMDTHFFFVPLRLVWENSKKFFGEQTDPGDSIDYTLPIFISGASAAEGSLSDYMGLPTGVYLNDITCIYHRGYNLIWNEWFRDQNLQDSRPFATDDGPDPIGDYTLQKRGKRHDYFTSALPWPQKGDAVSIPLGGYAPVEGIGVVTPFNYPLSSVGARETDGTGTDTYASAGYFNTENYALEEDPDNAGYPNIRTNLSSATAATINDLREAFQVQKLLERDARGGTRYSEVVRNHFGVNFYDVSYRPEFLGGGSTPINITPVASTTQTAITIGNKKVGDVSAFATAAFSGHGFTKSFVEHGFIIGLVSVRADLTYQQGVPRHFLKQTRYDIYWPSLAHLGEQEITNSEIYHQGTSDDDLVFGYTERYNEYRYKPSQITGSLRSTAAAPLDAWHLSQEFSSLPVLGDTFITEDPPIDRCLAISGGSHFIFDSYTSLKCARPIPMFGVPGLIDHF